ncbi:unnamed protein product [Dicrocoelium dendriticum]|nr:unnamed protein product [Dicrocoelium dendriticum]
MFSAAAANFASLFFQGLQAVSAFSTSVLLGSVTAVILFSKYRNGFRIPTFLAVSSASTEKRAALKELRYMRENGLRNSRRVVDIWESFLSRDLTPCQEKWVIMEQVFIAALDVGDDQLACECLGQLRAHFKKSSRINRLFGMYLEATGRFEDAQSVYAQVLKDDPTNTFVRRRKVAIFKSQKRNIEAIDELRNYLKTFMSDFEAWNELADLYLAEGDFKHAAFCLEEMLLSSPHNHLYCQRYAETCSALEQQSGKPLLDSVSISHLMSTQERRDPIESWDGGQGGRGRIRPVAKLPSGLTNSLELNRHLIFWAASKIQQLYKNALKTPPHSLVSAKGTLHKACSGIEPQPSLNDLSPSITSNTNEAAEERNSTFRIQHSLHNVGSQPVQLVYDS